MRKILRRLHARYAPFHFAKWVNRQRCYVRFSNDPSGEWSVKLGVMPEVRGMYIGRVMLEALERIESEEDFMWTSDYLKTL